MTPNSSLTTANYSSALARQVSVVTLNDDEALINYTKPIVAELRANMVHVDADFSATPFNSDKSRAGTKIANAKLL